MADKQPPVVRMKSQGPTATTTIEESKLGKAKPAATQSNFPLVKKPFDFQKVKVIIKRGKNLDDSIVYLDKKWTLDNIEHFKPVIDGVGDEEGIEITLTCNLEAFQFIIKFLQEQDYDAKCAMINEITHDNILNIVVTADFLRLDHVYEMAW